MSLKLNRKILFFIYALFFVFLIAVPSITGLFSDWLWFKEVGFTGIFSKIIITKISLFVVTAFFVFLVLYLNFKLANSRSKIYQHFRPITVKLTENLRQVDFDKYIGVVGVLVIAFISILFGLAISSNWQTLLEFLNSTSFREADPIFGRDISYYFFTLPFVRMTIGILFFLTIVMLIGGVIVFVIRGSISYNQFNRKIFAASPAKVHLAVLGSFLFLLIAARIYFVTVPSLLYSVNGQFIGANYTDIYARLPVLRIMSIVALVAPVLFFIGVKRAANNLILIPVVLFFVISIAGGIIYPAIIQRFVVTPNELSKESPFIEHNIAATRRAWGIDKVQIRNLSGEKDLTLSDIKNNDSTIKNVRLWDRDPLLDTFGQLQEIRTYYDFVSVDNDRYFINGEYRQVMLSARELNSESLPNRTFINEQLVFTHGMGLTLGPVNQVTAEGLPVLFIKDLPPKSDVSSLDVKQPGIYFGELSSSPVIAKTKTKEFNYPSGDKNVFISYKGSGGVKLNSFAKKLLFAIRFGKVPILLSSDITPESRIMYHRNITERASKAFPFLSLDKDPYLVIDEDSGSLKWMYDAYTVSNRYPYSQYSPQGRRINYMRNSVKMVVDAYDGSIDAYVADNTDPLITTYSKIFPNVFKPIKEMPEDLKRHLRYPEDIFSHQSLLYSIYHMEKPPIFYNKEDQWEIPLIGKGEKVDPMMRHMIMKLPEEEKEEFILMIPFTPRQKDNLSAWLVARSDGNNYGKLVIYRFPKQSLVFGPKQIINRINQDAEISGQISLWDQRGSQVIRGNLLVIPIEESLIYVQPLYLRAEGGKIPELKRVIVAYKNDIAMEETLEESIRKIFGEEKGGKIVEAPSEKIGEVTEDREALIQKAREHYEKALEAQRDGDWAEYGKQIEELGKVLEKL